MMGRIPRINYLIVFYFSIFSLFSQSLFSSEFRREPGFSIPHFFSASAETKGSFDLRFNKGMIRFNNSGMAFNLIQISNRSLTKPNIDRAILDSVSSIELIELRFLNSNNSCELNGLEPLASRTNYFYGNNSSDWSCNLQNYNAINYKNLYDYIDLKYYVESADVKYDFTVYPGGDVSNIKMRYDGISKLSLNSEGALVIATTNTEVLDYLPKSYQMIDGEEIQVKVRFKILDNCTVGFQPEAYNKNYPLVIDPVLVYSTFIGGNANEYQWVGGIDRDAFGNIYHTGRTFSSNFPTTAGAQQSAFGGNYDSYVFKLDPSGSTLIYSTFLGGANTDAGYSLKVEQATGNVWVVGSTDSPTFPVTAGAYQTTAGGTGLTDAYVLKLNAAGNGIIYSTLFGGGFSEYGHGIDIDNTGDVYVTGESNGNVFTTAGAFQNIYGGGPWDGWIVKFNPTLSTILYSTLFGGSQEDVPITIKVDQNKEVYIAGFQSGGSMPTVAGSYDVTFNGGAWDGFVAKFNSTLSSPLYATYLGTSGMDMIWNALHVNSLGEATVAGFASTGFPTTSGALQTTYAGGGADVFVTRLSANGSSLVYSTYVGGNGSDQAYGLYVNSADEIYVTGYCQNNFPMSPCTYDSTFNGGFDAFIVKLNPGATQLLFSTYIGGTGNDLGYCITVANDTVYVAGETQSSSFPVSAGAFDNSHNGGRDIFVLAIAPSTQNVLASFNAVTNVCKNAVVQFNNTSINATSYLWDFGDGSTSNLLSPSHQFLSSGIHSVRLITYGTCTLPDTFMLNISVQEPPVASFTFNDACDLSVSFTNTSTGSIFSSWDFGDGFSSSSVSPTHSYANPGIYNATLIVSNAVGCLDTLVTQITLNAPPLAAYSFVQPQCTLLVSLQNNSLNASSYSWDFGDGTISSLTDPNHLYLDTGSYTIRLIASSGACKDTVYQSLSLFLPPISAFNAQPQCNLVVDFNNTSLGANSYQWDFGDGSTSSSASATHTYAVSGSYTVTMISTNNFGCKDTVSNQIVVAPVPIAAFSLNNPPCTSTINLQNNSQNPGVTFWDFGDGNTTTDTDPVHQYVAGGSYLVTLIASPNWCPDTLTQMVSIIALPIADFSGARDCELKYNFSDNSIGAIMYNWDFGDGTNSVSPNPVHTYPVAGSYQVKLLITDQFNCQDTLTQNVIVTTDAQALFSFTAPICNSEIGFQNNSTNAQRFFWDFGDGKTSTVSWPTHNFLVSGTYNVTLIVDPAGCSDTISQVVTINRAPVVDFISDPNCTLSAEFINQTDSASIFHWDFGDGISTVFRDPIHQYQTSGEYTVTLIGTNDIGCTDTVTKTVQVLLFTNASYTTDYDTCLMKAEFNSNASGLSQAYWSFGDGTTASTLNTEHIYSLPGTYEVTFITNFGTVCADTSLQDIVVAREPDFGLYIPNCFTPNGDGLNELFEVVDYSYCDTYHLMIFNRWGEMIFETVDLENKWDGTYNGRSVPEGVYAWLLKSDLDYKQGSVTVLK